MVSGDSKLLKIFTPFIIHLTTKDYNLLLISDKAANYEDKYMLFPVIFVDQNLKTLTNISKSLARLPELKCLYRRNKTWQKT